MNYEIIDDFLSAEDFALIKNMLVDHQQTAWFLNTFVTTEDQYSADLHSYYFTHLYYADYAPRSDQIKLLGPIIEKLNVRSLIRIKANLYPNTSELKKHSNHQDYFFPHKAAVFYVNNNDGFTILDDTVKVESKENRVLIFDPSTFHCSTTCTNEKFRITLNFNYF